jgi:aerobic carbon-monoxide dehydrogenase small subunit
MSRAGKDPMEKKTTIKLIVNGELVELLIGHHVEPSETLVHTLRETLGLTGTKTGCNLGECGACTVLMDGKPILSCTTLTVECDGKEITTIEGLGDPIGGKLHPLQQAFIDHDGMQCGFCTPGMIMQAKALLDRNPDPTEQQVKEGLSGNLCRCGSYKKIVESVLAAASAMRGE